MSGYGRHPIRVAARRTGTPETTLRAWERRYGAVSPGRGESGRRLYSDEDIERLKLLRRAVDGGRSISDVAGLSNAALRVIVSEDRADVEAVEKMTAPIDAAAPIVDSCLDAIENMDPAAVRSLLNRAILKFPALSLIDEIIAPLLHRIGDYWESNRFTPRHEHMASSVVRDILTQLQSGIQHTGPETVVIATPPGQLHDLGTQFVSVLSLAEGWSVVNLGANITAADIATTATEVDATIVALSIVYPENDRGIEEALVHLGKHLGEDTRLVVGGRAAGSYSKTIRHEGGVVMQTATQFAEMLTTRFNST